MFGGKNGRRVEARRAPSKKAKKEDDLCCGGCCQALANCCISCGAHGWFLTLFCGYVLVSSLPRILIILDFIITVSLYFDINGNVLKNRNWVQNSFTFTSSTFDVVIISFFRCIILFICFAYRFQREGYRKNIYVAFITVLLSSIYLIIKLLYNETSIVIFSLSFVWVECIFFFMVRRRRIRYAPTLSSIGSYYSLSQRDRKIMKPGKSKYYRIDDDDHSPHASLVGNNNNNNNYSSSEDVVIATTNAPHKPLVFPTSATPPPSFINDTYLDDMIGENDHDHKQRKRKRREKKKKASTNDMDIDKEEKQDLDDIDLDHHEEEEKEQKKRKKGRKFKPKPEMLSQQHLEHSMSATVPDSEFSAHELPLRTENSEFFIIDGVAIHYCFEKNYNESVINNDDLPWIILLHGFGGGVFSWKRTMSLLLSNMNENIRGVLAFDRVGFGLTERPLTEEQEELTTDLEDDNTNLGQAITPSNKPISKRLNNKEDENNPYSIHFSLKIIKTFVDKFNMNKCILIGHSTGGLIANWFAYHYPSYCDAVILISPTTGMPMFIRSILKTKLGKPIILSLVRSEIGQVTLHQAWHNPSAIPSSVIHSYKQVLKLKNWNESLLEMAKVKPYSNSSKYHKALSMITCPVWLLHGDDDKLVTFRESVTLSQHFKYPFGPIKLENCGHIPHQEIPKEFVDLIKKIITEQLVQFNQHKSSYQLNDDDDEDDENENNNIINKGAKKFKQMIKNINIMHRTDSNEMNLKDNASNVPLKNDQSTNINNNDIIDNDNKDDGDNDMKVMIVNDTNIEDVNQEVEINVSNNDTNNNNNNQVTESSALLYE